MFKNICENPEFVFCLFFEKTYGEQSTDQTKMDTIESGNLNGNMGQEKSWFSYLSNFSLDVPLNRFLANAGSFGLFAVLLIKVSVDQFYENHDSDDKDTLRFESGAYFFLGFFSFSKFCDDIYTLINFKPMDRFFYNFWRCYGLLMNTMFGLSLILRLIRLIGSRIGSLDKSYEDGLQNWEAIIYANFIVIAIIR